MLTLPPLAGTIEYAISEDRMTEEGELWEPEGHWVSLNSPNVAPWGSWTIA